MQSLETSTRKPTGTSMSKLMSEERLERLSTDFATQHQFLLQPVNSQQKNLTFAAAKINETRSSNESVRRQNSWKDEN